MEQGYDRLATAAVATAGAMLGAGDPELDRERDGAFDEVCSPVSFREALHLLNLNTRRMAGHRSRRRPPLPPEAWKPGVIAKFELIERAFQAKMTPAERAAPEGGADGAGQAWARAGRVDGAIGFSPRRSPAWIILHSGDGRYPARHDGAG